MHCRGAGQLSFGPQKISKIGGWAVAKQYPSHPSGVRVSLGLQVGTHSFDMHTATSPSQPYRRLAAGGARFVVSVQPGEYTFGQLHSDQ